MKQAIPLYLYFWFSSAPMLKTMQSSSTSTGVPNMNLANLKRLPVLLPPLTEQRAIAAVLDSIDEAIERTEAVITATEQLRDALLQELLTRGVPGWHTEWKEAPSIGTIPANWKAVRLGDVAEVNPRRPRIEPKSNPLVGFIPMAVVKEQLGGIQKTLRRPYEEVRTGYTYFENQDVLFAKITPCLQNRKHALINDLSDGYGFGTTEFHVLRSGDSLEPRHLFRVVTQPHNIKKCADSFTGTAGQQRVQPDTIRSLPVPLPPLPEQRSIAAALDALERTIERGREERDGLQTLKGASTDALLTGRLRIRRVEE